jgi:hypothetical protein
MVETVKPYIDHLRPPGVAFMSIADYNTKFDANIKANADLEKAVKKARHEMGPNDFLVQSFGLKRQRTPPKNIKMVTVEKTEEKTLDDMLAEDLEEEYEEQCDNCGKDKKGCKGHNFEQNLESMPIEDAQTLNHLVGFRSEEAPIEDRVMKGKTRYIDQLKAYVNGDNTAEVRMLNGKKIKVSELRPNKASLKEMFANFPSGPHIIECD